MRSNSETCSPRVGRHRQLVLTSVQEMTLQNICQSKTAPACIAPGLNKNPEIFNHFTYPALCSDSPERGVRNVEVPDARLGSVDISRPPAFREDDDALLGHAAGMGRASPGFAGAYRDRSESGDRSLGTAGTPGLMDDETSYDYFRRGRR